MARCEEFSAARWLQCENNFAPLWLQWTKPMATVHNEIDNWLAADLHGDLSDAERSAFHAHLLDCAACRKAHQETKTMNKILEETLAQEKPDLRFEQRMLAGFRNRVPAKSWTGKIARRSDAATPGANHGSCCGLARTGATRSDDYGRRCDRGARS